MKKVQASMTVSLVSVSHMYIPLCVNARQNLSKTSVSVVDGYAFLDTLSWDSSHEGELLQESVEKYKERYGYYPEAILAITIYRTRENCTYCKKLGIRLSDPKLGRLSKDEQLNAVQKQKEKQDATGRNAIEGKFWEC